MGTASFNPRKLTRQLNPCKLTKKLDPCKLTKQFDLRDFEQNTTKLIQISQSNTKDMKSINRYLSMVQMW